MPNGTMHSAPKPSRLVMVNDRGMPIGQDHHRAKLSDHDVELIHALREEGLMMRQIAQKFDVSLSTVESICLGRRRGQTAVGQRRLSTRR